MIRSRLREASLHSGEEVAEVERLAHTAHAALLELGPFAVRCDEKHGRLRCVRVGTHRIVDRESRRARKLIIEDSEMYGMLCEVGNGFRAIVQDRSVRPDFIRERVRDERGNCSVILYHKNMHIHLREPQIESQCVCHTMCTPHNREKQVSPHTPLPP